MPEEKQPKKRLVPWKEYLRNRITKKGLVGLFFVSTLILPIVIIFVSRWYEWGSLLFFGYLFWGIKLLAKMMVYAQKMEDVELLTSDKVGQLPAEETLVRASLEPTPEPEKVLLRAATSTEEIPQEQLLRPSSTSE